MKYKSLSMARLYAMLRSWERDTLKPASGHAQISEAANSIASVHKFLRYVDAHKHDELD